MTELKKTSEQISFELNGFLIRLGLSIGLIALALVLAARFHQL